jgi:hypothetical protein
MRAWLGCTTVTLEENIYAIVNTHLRHGTIYLVLILLPVVSIVSTSSASLCPLFPAPGVCLSSITGLAGLAYGLIALRDALLHRPAVLPVQHRTS